MEVISIKEMEDGSAELTLEMTEEENRLLIEYAVVDILKEHIKELEGEKCKE